MDLDKYRRNTPITSESTSSVAPSVPPEAPILNGSADAIRQKTSRYRSYVNAENSTPESEVQIPTQELADSVKAVTNLDVPEAAKGNKFKSGRNGRIAKKLSVNRPTATRRKEAPSLSGVKIVFLDETMREEYIQIAGYLMVKYRVKLTMTAYFCFLHEIAISQQTDESFLSNLARFAKSESSNS
ncbi:hypothetical protein FAES_pFAES01047 (plasmid) [Fibrella aestuarina BUZ 2]|uniref:Uncharacterized protein n=1 Tax=Fibrella aestuarina BUZ 2 TaxID=1166018 RepID=I0KHD8_9BACT|nr:hypothetical protein [Fibrella aestuarina]CCH03541.1 hypothetical protein FAES_pFAES01047 [Fibrella aestuarina BUZ 2]